MCMYIVCEDKKVYSVTIVQNFILNTNYYYNNK